MNNKNTFSIDEAKFLKTSKKLMSEINDFILQTSDIESAPFSLSKVQELLAQSLGFRNLHELQKVFNEIDSTTKEIISSIHKPYIFNNIEADQSVHIILNLMDNSGSGDMWRGRALSLISFVMKILVHMRNEKEIILNSDTISEYLILDNLIKLLKTRKDFPESIKRDLRSYLTSLPGYQEAAPKQNDVVLEQHGYLQMQFFNAINKLKNIEDNNFIIAEQSWFILDNRENFTVRGSNIKNSNIKKILNSTEYKALSLHPKLEQCEFLEDSWIYMPEYENWIYTLYLKKQLNSIRISDLIIYVTTVISPTKRQQLLLVLNSILDNFSIASNISKEIIKTLK